jgi:phosphoserine phosphatase
VLIARLIAEPARLSENHESARVALAEKGVRIASGAMLEAGSQVMQIDSPDNDAGAMREVLDACFAPSALLVADRQPVAPRLFVSDMDSTMIGQECIDELADFAGLKNHIAVITERAMQGELDFESALRERVLLLRDLSESAIRECLDTRISPMEGAKTLVSTLKAMGCRTVLVTGGFHQFADPVAEQLGFDHTVANRLEIASGSLTGGLVGSITGSSAKWETLLAEMARLGEGAASLATGDGANDIPMLEAASYGIAYRAKPKARAAANGWIDHGDLTTVLQLLGIPESEWVSE